MKNIFEYLPAAYENGSHDAKAREQMATASTMAGMAFANAFLGVCHSMAHKLGHYAVAEGVETEKQKKYLEENGCDKIQGYLISRPLDIIKAIEFLGITNK